MATDDDKQVPEPDPWAGLDSGGAEDAAAEDFGEDFTFAFDGLKEAAAAREDSSDSDGPAFESATSLDDGHRDGAADDIPLVVFPPPDVETTGSEAVIGTERSDIISMSNAVDDSGEEDFDGHDAAGDGFDDNDIAHEMGLLDAEGEAIAAEALASGDDFDGAADFGDPWPMRQSAGRTIPPRFPSIPPWRRPGLPGRLWQWPATGRRLRRKRAAASDRWLAWCWAG